MAYDILKLMNTMHYILLGPTSDFFGDFYIFSHENRKRHNETYYRGKFIFKDAKNGTFMILK